MIDYHHTTMKSTTLLYLGLLASLVCVSYGFRILPQKFFAYGRNLLPTHNLPTNLERNKKLSPLQTPIMQETPPDVSPSVPDGNPGDDYDDISRGDGDLIVSDILNKERDINGFASLARQIKPVFARLNDGSKNTTVLAPSNAALQRLPRKPWESPADYEAFGQEDAYVGQQGRERAAENLKKFVEIHAVPDSPWPENSEIETLGGAKTYWTKEQDGKAYVSYVECPLMATCLMPADVSNFRSIRVRLKLLGLPPGCQMVKYG